jgi:hypothetical protein
MGYKTGDDAEILRASNEAFEKVASATAVATLAGDFGVSATHGSLTLNASGRADSTPDHLDQYGKAHWKAADDQATAETKAGTAQARERNAGKLSDRQIERDVPLERYKQAVLSQVAPELDKGKQIVGGQWNHFVRIQGFTDEFVIKDDPGHFTGANEQATWEEARAMGLFLKWISIG